MSGFRAIEVGHVGEPFSTSDTSIRQRELGNGRSMVFIKGRPCNGKLSKRICGELLGVALSFCLWGGFHDGC